MASHDGGSMTGLTSGEAREFHRIFMKSTIAFTGWAFAAHALVAMWRPWFWYDGSNPVVSSSLDMIKTLPFFG